jgi:uncharacterized protein
MCIVTREAGTDETLIRFARAPDGTVVPDLQAKLPGRGVWVTCSARLLAEAVKRQAFKRGFDTDCTVPQEIAQQVSSLLRRQAVNTLSLARKAGEAVQGFTKVEEALRKGPVAVLLHASHAGADGVEKLDRLKGHKTVISNSFRGDEMDLAFGRPNVIHAAIATGGLADRLVLHLQRMASFDSDGPTGSEGLKETL